MTPITSQARKASQRASRPKANKENVIVTTTVAQIPLDRREGDFETDSSTLVPVHSFCFDPDDEVAEHVASLLQSSNRAL
jgi:hypothetical protein